MNIYLTLAAILIIILGVAHSGIGEMLIFRHWRNDSTTQQVNGVKLSLRHKRILWVSWHLASALGWGFAAILYALAYYPIQELPQNFIKNIIFVSMCIGGMLVLFGTRGKHPGWAVFFVIAGLTWLG